MRAIDAHALGRYIADWEYTLMGFNECGGCEADLLNDVFHVIEHWPTLTNESEWINADTQLPETTEAAGHEVSLNVWICIQGVSGERYVCESRLIDGRWLHVPENAVVTHWMPCETPTPPSESAH